MTTESEIPTDISSQLPQEFSPTKVTENKSLIKLFKKQSDCCYVSCYCEENVYKLCQDVLVHHPSKVRKCYAVFVSNECRKVPLWRQKSGKEDDRLVIWDYHVIFLYHPDSERCLIYDLDSDMPFPTYFHKYITETFRTDQILKPKYYRYFRVIPAMDFLNDFASDRRHMKRLDGSWIKPPPTYPAIHTSTTTHNLEDYIQMNTCNGHGQVFNLSQFVQYFYKHSVI